MLLRRSTDDASAWIKLATPDSIAIFVGAAATAAYLAISSYWLLRARTNTRKLKSELADQAAGAKAADAANRGKAEFLTSMSHQIRTPLNAIMGFTDLALRSDLRPELRDYLDTVRLSADWLLQIANDVLDFSRLEAGTLCLESLPLSISECAHSALKLVESAATAKKLSVSCSVDRRLPNLVRGDPTRLRHVIFVLLDNAIKLTSRGSVALSVVLDGESDQDVTIRVAVDDTGMGVTGALRSAIFEPYQHIDASAPPQDRGSGVGLAMAKRIVELMGGTMDVQSQLGAGSRFEFTARLAKESNTSAIAQEPVLPEEAPKQNDVKILVAEDNTLNRKLITTVLESAGCRVESACDGKGAVDKVRSESFDLVLMDVEMPELDGLQATREIRATEKESAHTPIFALTAHASAEDRARCLDAGMDEFISKPVQVDELLKLVSHLSRTSPPPTVTDEESLPTSKDHDEDPIPVSDPREVPDADEPIAPAVSPSWMLETPQPVPEDEPGRNAEDLDAIARTLYQTLQPSGPFASSAQRPHSGDANSVAVAPFAPQVQLRRPAAFQASTVWFEGVQSTPAAVMVTPSLSSTEPPATGGGDWNPFEQARQALFRSRFDVRIIHQDGDPSNRNLI